MECFQELIHAWGQLQYPTADLLHDTHLDTHTMVEQLKHFSGL